MEIRQLSVPHAWEFSPIVRGDDRGTFLESYRADLLEDATGRRFNLRQANLSMSSRGVARGIHFSDVPYGQAKYVTVASGSVLDIAIDIRVGSPTFGQWDAVELNDVNRKALFLSEGLGHMFVVTSASATVFYLTNDVYRPEREHAVAALDPDIGIEFPVPPSELVLSPRDEAAPSLSQAREAGLLPTWQDALDRYAEEPA
jgi:dTDP-4-dehydrorhamnose 3,5-epimerase